MSVKLWFSDFWAGFDTVENKFVRILKKSFDIEVTPKNPDFLIYSVFGNEHYKFRGCIKIFYAGEACFPDFDECDYAATVNPIGFEDRHFQVTFFDMLSVIDLNREVSERLLNRRFCNFIYSNVTATNTTTSPRSVRSSKRSRLPPNRPGQWQPPPIRLPPW